jgi:hypothetical protein
VGENWWKIEERIKETLAMNIKPNDLALRIESDSVEFNDAGLMCLGCGRK